MTRFFFESLNLYNTISATVFSQLVLLCHRTCRLFTSQSTCAMAAVLFAVHPVHTEAVSANHNYMLPLNCLTFSHVAL